MIKQAEVKKSNHELCKLEILIDDLKDVDIAPLLNLCMNFDASEIEAVDVRNESSCVLNGEYALSLMRAVNKKLRVVHLQELSYGKDFLRYIMVFMMNYLCINDTISDSLLTLFSPS